VDALIVGAGLSGIGAACHLQTGSPGTSYAIVEARGTSGGTWDLFRYPGVRSDSDMFTLGYRFKPWTDAASIAGGDDILRYVRDTAKEHGVDEQIAYHRKVLGADWSSADARWAVTVEDTDTGEISTRTCSFLFLCAGYYSYDEGYTPTWPGQEDYAGALVHPQFWPADLDVAGKRVVVIGSGATAVTLVPALAETAASVVMLQRSPSFILSMPTRDAIGDRLRRWLPEKRAYAAVRWRNISLGTLMYRLVRRFPDRARRFLEGAARRQLPEGYDVQTHFSPRYNVWDQRLCLAPDGDFFAAIRHGRAEVVTDQVDTFTPTGIRLASGRVLDADVVVTATGLNLMPLGGIELSVNGEPVRASERVTYKGMMLDGVPNMAFVIGYTNASWTLKADLVSEYVARLLAHMERHGYDVATPRLPARRMDKRPLIEMTSGYFQRSLDKLPLQGDRTPWRLRQHYRKDAAMFRRRVDGPEMEFARRAAP